MGVVPLFLTWVKEWGEQFERCTVTRYRNICNPCYQRLEWKMPIIRKIVKA
ncbi:Uncharacterised protein [Serratia fonticola]|nr:Uncharacterised protein [Serratia fonticola]